MGRSKRQDKKHPQIPTAPTYVETKDVFATFVAQADLMGQEVAARREFDEDVGAFLKERGLLEDFETFRKRER